MTGDRESSPEVFAGSSSLGAHGIWLGVAEVVVMLALLVVAGAFLLGGFRVRRSEANDEGSWLDFERLKTLNL
ncbi:hypothetical protein PF008_g19676 [Phytophthora fragariae]|uniref:Uncharacterized protein n=1 Tax=Phytophthora fragariae TaxID=53985 RepID=A0A6G0R2T8_9STRA|nr:hypothetical protein PF008_g19676 [Phytophthora fragariae]